MPPFQPFRSSPLPKDRDVFAKAAVAGGGAETKVRKLFGRPQPSSVQEMVVGLSPGEKEGTHEIHVLRVSNCDPALKFSSGP